MRIKILTKMLSQVCLYNPICYWDIPESTAVKRAVDYKAGLSYLGWRSATSPLPPSYFQPNPAGGSSQILEMFSNNICNVGPIQNSLET